MKTKTLALLIAGTVITAGTAISIATPASFKSNLAKGYLWDDTSSTQSQLQPSDISSSEAASNPSVESMDSTSQNPDTQATDSSSEASTTDTTATPALDSVPFPTIEAQQPDPSANSPMITADVRGVNPSTNSTVAKPTREEFVQFAKDEMNKRVVAATTPAGVDETDSGKRQFRQGWERLDQYFELAYGGRFNKKGKPKYDQDVVKYITIIKKTTTDKDGNVVTKDVDALKSWCGIFALWALKSKSLATEANWVSGVGFEGLLGKGIKRVDLHQIQIGDIGVLVYGKDGHRLDHHFIISEMQNGKITGTINGNGENAMVSPGDGSRVNEAIEAQTKDPSKALVSFYTAF